MVHDPTRSRTNLGGTGQTAAVTVLADRRSGRQSLDIGSAQRVTGDAPVAALHLLDHHPGHRTHVLALDGDHGLGQIPDDLGAWLTMKARSAADFLSTSPERSIGRSLPSRKTYKIPDQNDGYFVGPLGGGQYGA